MITATYANNTIPRSDHQYHPKKLEYDTSDIIDLVLWADKRVKADTREFSKAIAPNLHGMKELYEFLLFQLRYKPDPKGSQWVRSPARLWSDRKGDCKSYTLFITSVLQNLGLDYIIRFTSYKSLSKTPTHVYPIAILPDGREVIIDPVWGYQGKRGIRGFNTEKPYAHKTDYQVEKGLAYLTGTSDQGVLDGIDDILNSIPDSVLEDDITKKTEGELQRMLMAQRLEIAAGQDVGYDTAQNLRYAASVLKMGDMASVGSVKGETQSMVFNFLRTTATMNRPAFTPPVLRLKKSEVSGLKDFFKRVGKGIKNAAQAVGSFFKRAWAKLMNWIFKGPLQKSGPFFLYTFIKQDVGGEVSKRKAKQQGVLDWMAKLGVSRTNMKAALQNGIISELGASPSKILNDAAKKRISGPEVSGFAAAMIAAIGFIINVIKKIAALFKKGDAPVIREADASVLDLLMPRDAGYGSSSRPSKETRMPTKYDGYESPQYRDNVSQRQDSGSSSGGAGAAMGIAAMLAMLLMA